MSLDSSASLVPIGRHARVRVFVDYWNLQLALNEQEKRIRGEDDPRFKIDWRLLPQCVAAKAANIVGLSEYAYEGAIIYVSYNPRTDIPFRSWLLSWLNRQPGIQVDARERRPKSLATCPACHQTIGTCPRCNVKIAATVEKGVDTAIVTDMIRLAWEDAYDIGVLVSSDGDLTPAVQFLDKKGRKIIQAGFPPSGAHLATACWASFDMLPLRESFRRA